MKNDTLYTITYGSEDFGVCSAFNVAFGGSGVDGPCLLLLPFSGRAGAVGSASSSDFRLTGACGYFGQSK